MCVLKGEVWLRVDGGKEEVVKEGGFCVQRGGLHSVSCFYFLDVDFLFQRVERRGGDEFEV